MESTSEIVPEEAAQRLEALKGTAVIDEFIGLLDADFINPNRILILGGSEVVAQLRVMWLDNPPTFASVEDKPEFMRAQLLAAVEEVKELCRIAGQEQNISYYEHVEAFLRGLDFSLWSWNG